MLLNRTNSQILELYVAQSLKYFKNRYHVNLRDICFEKFYVAAYRVLFAHLTPVLFFSNASAKMSLLKRKPDVMPLYIQNPFKDLRWSVFSYPVKDFKLLAVYAKTLHLRTSIVEGVSSTPVLRLHLAMFCVIITNIW